MTRKKDDYHLDQDNAEERSLGSLHSQPHPFEEGGVTAGDPAEFKIDPHQDPAVAAAIQETEQLRKRAAELEDRLLRSAADFDNYRKRTARQFEEMEKTAGDRVLTDLLDIADNFRRAMENSAGTADSDAYRQGIAMIFEQMSGLLAKYDIRPIESLGRPFDPNLHDALMRMASDQYGEGIVAMEMSPGYKRGDRVLRHAKVGVSTGKAE